jgi:acetylglutamate kinase
VTDEAAIGVVARVLGEEINPFLVETITRFGGRAAGLSGMRIFEGVKAGATGAGGAPVDLGFVGEVQRVDCAAVLEEVARDSVPVVTPLAAEAGTGHPLNVNADLAASALAVALRAPKLVYLSDVPGVMRDPSDPETLISTIDAVAFGTLTARGVIQGGMLPKVRSALEAIAAGVGKVHLIDGRIRHSLLLEVFTRDGIGTQVVA